MFGQGQVMDAGATSVMRISPLLAIVAILYKLSRELLCTQSPVCSLLNSDNVPYCEPAPERPMAQEEAAASAR